MASCCKLFLIVAALTTVYTSCSMCAGELLSGQVHCLKVSFVPLSHNFANRHMAKFLKIRVSHQKFFKTCMRFFWGGKFFLKPKLGLLVTQFLKMFTWMGNSHTGKALYRHIIKQIQHKTYWKKKEFRVTFMKLTKIAWMGTHTLEDLRWAQPTLFIK
jgi:hypothetical protein